MKNKIKWFLFNGSFITAVYFGFFEDVIGLRRIVIFVATILVLVSLFSFTDGVQEIIKKAGRSVPIWIDILVDVIVIFALIWCGAIYTGIVYTIYSVLHHAAIDSALSLSEDKKP